MSTHYFLTPDTPEQRNSIRVRIHGRSLDVVTSSGVFSPKTLDKGTAVLLDHVPTPHGNEFLDLGCGWGPITLALGLAARERQINDATQDIRISAVDINERSLALTHDNAVAHGINAEVYMPEQVPSNRRFDTLWSNPPIRIGKEALHHMLLLWLPRLSPDGEAWMVVQKNLGSDSLQRWLAQALPNETGQRWSVDRVASSQGFRVLRIKRTLQ